MKLSQMQKDQKAIIKEIDLPLEIKQRLGSMGLVKNEMIRVCRVGLFGGSFYVKVSCESCIIINKNEADHIEVELIGRGHKHRWGKRAFLDGCGCCEDEK